MNPPHATFHHERIDTSKRQIRLLRISPTLSQDEILQCDIHTVDLSDQPEYQAISYEWGPKTPARKIGIGESHHVIRDNLWQFLDMFRTQAENTGLLWIDQISINQCDHQERNHQVQMMGEIYANARRVIARLGRTELEPGAIRSAIDGHQEVFWKCDVSNCPICRIRDLSSDPATAIEPYAQSSLDLIERSYWARLWITQELALAKDIKLYLGTKSLTPEDVIKYCSILDDMKGYLDDVHGYRASRTHINALLNLIISNASEHRFTLAMLLTKLDPSYMQCAERRDLVFGLLGMVRPSEYIHVDYSLPTEELYGVLLDRIVATPNLGLPSNSIVKGQRGVLEGRKPWRWPFRDHLAWLGTELGVPCRWRRWLMVSREDPMALTVGINNFVQGLNALEGQGLSKSGWTMDQLALIVRALLSSEWIWRGLRITESGEEAYAPNVQREIKALVELVNEERGIMMPTQLTPQIRVWNSLLHLRVDGKSPTT